MSRESVYHSPTGLGGMSERSSSARSTRGGRQALSTVRDAVAADRDPASPYGMMHDLDEGMGDLRKLNAMQKAVEEAREQQAVAARYRRVAESLRHGMVGFKFCWLRARLDHFARAREWLVELSSIISIHRASVSPKATRTGLHTVPERGG